MELSKKLSKRMAALKAAGGMLPWFDAPKQYRQLKDLGLIVEGELEGESFAVLAELAQESEQ